jgi:signal peptidase I
MSVRKLVGSASWLVLWMYLYLVAVLGVWVLVAWVATGWQPSTVTSGSMAPAIRTGDVVFYDDAETDEIAQRTIILFSDSEGQRVLHRVFAVTDDGFITKGDANADPDIQPIGANDIVGVGRLVVPLVGLPIVWWSQGQFIVVAAWLVLTVGATATGLLRSSGWRSFQRNARRPGSAVTRKALRRVRALVALMILGQYFIDPSRLDMTVGLDGLPSIAVLVGSLSILASTNLLSIQSTRTNKREDLVRWSLAELALDTALVIGLTTTTGTKGIGWVLFALPIIEAAARFRLAGALTHWMVLTGVTISTRMVIGAHSPESSFVLLGDLDRLVDQLSVLLLVVIPGAYLAEQLVTDVLILRKATAAAEYRSQLLHQVAELGQEVTQIDRNLFDTLTRGMISMQIEAADVVASQPGSRWTVLSAVSAIEGQALPIPGEPASGLRPGDMAERSVEIDAGDPDIEDRVALLNSSWTNIVRLAIDGPNKGIIAVRAATTTGLPVAPEIVNALQLLLGQAAVGIENNHLVDELRSLNNRVNVQATQDELTGLPNRRLLVSTITESITDRALADTKGTSGSRAPSLLFLDLDGFKPINDRFGHEGGDELLMAVAGRLTRAVGEHGHVARFGGDEFVVLLHGKATDDGVIDPIVMADRLVEAVAQPFAIAPGQVTVTASIGLAELEEGDNAGEFIRRADVAMYKAKKDVTIRWAQYEPSMDASARRAAELAPYLADAIAKNELTLNYQPLITSDTRRMAGVEALLRWTSDEFGPLPPDEIVHVAETSGLLDALNRWVAEHATAQVADWQRRFGIPDLFLTINASPTELQSRHLASNLSRALLLSGLDPSALIVELSERVTTEQDADMFRSLDELAALGIRVVLDDFGQGQTSLAHLRQLPLVGIKLDRQLVFQAAEQTDDLVILTSIVGLAHDLNLRVVAEGVETEHQFALVADAGVDLVQGYLVGRPVEASVITRDFFTGELEVADAGPLSHRGGLG